MWLDFQKIKSPKLKDPTMIVAVSTSMPQYRILYSQGRQLGDYMLKKMKFERIATIRSSAFPPEVIVRDNGISTLPECNFSLNSDGRDLVLFTGDSSPMESQYDFARMLLDYAKDLDVKELYSVGTRWAESPLSPDVEPEPNGFSTDKVGVAKLRRNGVKVIAEEPAPFFASLVIGMAREYGIRGYKLSVDHGEPSPHPRSVARLLRALSAMIGFHMELDTNEQAKHDPEDLEELRRDNRGSAIYR